MRATTGETKLLPLPLAWPSEGSLVVSDAAAGAGVASSTVSAVGVVAGESLAAFDSAAACAVAGSGTSPSPSDDGATSVPSGAITASFVPTSTVSPSWTRISATTPDAGDGTSVSTLSVEISSRLSSALICSPTCLSHFVIVPSETDTPIWGMTTSVAPATAISTPRAPSVP